MDGVVRQLATLLPETFDELKTPFACAVVDADTGAYKIIREGNLPEAVTASAAVPVLFAPVSVAGVDGGPWQDGGKHDRVGLEGWQELRTGGLVGGHVDEGPIVHLIERSSPFSGADDVDMSARACGATVVRSPKSGQSLLALNKDTFKQQREIAAGRYARARATASHVGTRARRSVAADRATAMLSLSVDATPSPDD